MNLEDSCFGYCSHMGTVNKVSVKSECENIGLVLDYYANHCLSCGTYFLDGKSFGGPRKMADYYINKKAREILGGIPKNLVLRASEVKIEMITKEKDSSKDF